MSDIDRIKDRIRKLMAYANDGAASEGEIENAMAHAAKLIDAHHLDADEFKGGETHPVDADKIEFGQAYGTSQSTRFSQWETILANAVCNLFGCVKWYVTRDQSPIRVNGVAQTDKGGDVKRGLKTCFYGPLLEAGEAGQLFEEWSRLIASMGVIRWGGCFRGDGAMYCLGFARAVAKQATKINEARGLVAAKAPAELAGPTTTAITLSGRYDLIRKGAESWLRNVRGVHLRNTGGGGGYSGSSDAFNEGHAHGEKAGFGRKANRKLLPS